MAEFSKWIEATPEDHLVDVARRSLRSRLAPVTYYVELAARSGVQEIEHVHQMRVWTRRSGAAIGLYRSLLPKRRRKWLNAALKQIRGGAGDARDDDVFAQRLAAVPDPRAARVLETVRAHRQAAQRPIQRLYAKLFREHRFQRRVEELLDRVRIRDGSQDDPPIDFRSWAIPQLRDQVDAFFQAAAGDFADYAELHRFRIAGKRLRYTIELLASAFDPSLRRETYLRVQDLQERLGQINDHASAARRLDSWIEHAGDAEQRGYLRELQRLEETQMADQREAFLQWWSGAIVEGLREQFASCL